MFIPWRRRGAIKLRFAWSALAHDRRQASGSRNPERAAPEECDEGVPRSENAPYPRRGRKVPRRVVVTGIANRQDQVPALRTRLSHASSPDEVMDRSSAVDQETRV